MSIEDQNRLQKHVDSIAANIGAGFNDSDLTDDGEQMSAYDYLSDVLDIEYTVNGRGEYLGARVLVAFGGPNIWINTRTKTIEGYWWGDKAFADYEDSMGLDDALEEFWNCR
jgi:hypothetical protein